VDNCRAVIAFALAPAYFAVAKIILHCNIDGTGQPSNRVGIMAAKIITVAQQKGGAGKTTLVAHLAAAWAGSGRKVALVDIDPQHSLAAWYGMRAPRDDQGLDLHEVPGYRLSIALGRLADAYDVVVIDSPPHAETEARIAVRAADLALVPVQPSPMDLWATRPTLDLALAERTPALIVLNRVPARVNLTEIIRDQLRGYDAKIARARLGSRVAYAASMLEGRGVTEAAPRSRAADEIRKLGREILKAAA
jgi:chromosome partitioning protein